MPTKDSSYLEQVQTIVIKNTICFCTSPSRCDLEVGQVTDFKRPVTRESAWRPNNSTPSRITGTSTCNSHGTTTLQLNIFSFLSQGRDDFNKRVAVVFSFLPHQVRRDNVVWRQRQITHSIFLSFTSQIWRWLGWTTHGTFFTKLSLFLASYHSMRWRGMTTGSLYVFLYHY